MSTYRPPRGALRAEPESARDSLARRIGSIVWPSFFAAGVATTVFFAIVDPLDLAQITWPKVEITRQAGYTLGFFMFWLCTASACLFTALLVAPPLRDSRQESSPPS